MQLPARIPNTQKKRFNLRKKWPINESDVEDNPHEAPTFAYE
jgi:hypothetical protein